MAARPKLTQQRRLQALEAAVEVIGKKGLSETRIVDIAERAALSPALLLYYFGSKDELLTEALTFAEDRFYLNTFHELTEVDDPRRRLVRLIDLSCPAENESGELLGDWTLWIELWARALRDAQAARKREALDRRWRGTIAEIVRSGQEQGLFSPTNDADDFSLRLAALMDGLALQVVLRDPAVTPSKMKHACVQTAASELGFDLEEDAPLVASGEGRRASQR